MVAVTINGEGRRLDSGGVTTRGVGWTKDRVEKVERQRRVRDQTVGEETKLFLRIFYFVLFLLAVPIVQEYFYHFCFIRSRILLTLSQSPPHRITQFAESPENC